MGKQIAVAMSLEDEKQFLTFLREEAEVSIYRSWSPKAEPVRAFSSEPEASPFYIHNIAFPWAPEFKRVEYNDKNSAHAGSYYRLTNTHGPIVEYSRHPMQSQSPQVAGRIYWSKHFVTAEHLTRYDLETFEAWYTRVATWLRKHAKRVRHGTTEPWCMPGAQRLLANKA